MIKRLFSTFIIAFLLVSPITASADAVMGNEFLYKNKDKTVEIANGYSRKAYSIWSKRFSANSPIGYVIPKEEPGSNKGVAAGNGYHSGWGGDEDVIIKTKDGKYMFENGDIVYIEAVYLHNGEYWGVMPPSHMIQPTGWIPMNELLMLYEREDFDEKHKDELYDYTDGYDAVYAAKKIVFWQWPGSDREKRTVDCTYDEFNINSISTAYAYKDQQGLIWGYINIKYSYRSQTSPYIDNRPYYPDCYDSGWICLSDPENSNIPAFNPAPKPTKWSPDGIYDWSADVAVYPPADTVSLIISGNFNMTVLIISLVVVLIAGSVILIIIFKKRNKTGGKLND